ncbi:MAG: molybdenum cofactor guanylyltransferase [Deltaproteobacteria bacterium]|nr:molybdenum cofactor guanylyltransferase [Deltaproteobacteria bacterium]
MGRVAGQAIAVLAGGLSRRMGEDKRWLRLDGEALIARAWRLAEATRARTRTTGEIVISGALASLPAGCTARVIRDGEPERGPLEAIRTVLLALAPAAERVLFIPVDMPLLTAVELERLLVQEGDVVHFSGYELPICVSTSLATRDVVGALARGSRRSVRALIEALAAVTVAANEPCMVNVNTPEEWSALVRSQEAK